MKTMHEIELKPIVFKTCRGYCYLVYDQIIMIQAHGNCSLVYTLDEADPIRVLHNLNFISRKYYNKTFFRCHKSFFINLRHAINLEVKSRKLCLTKGLVAMVSDVGLKILRQYSIKQNSL